MQTVEVSLGPRSYPIIVGSGASCSLPGCIAGASGDRQAVVIADRTVAELHFRRLVGSLRCELFLLTFPAGEASKSLGTVERLGEELAAQRIERDAIIVAFGGGVAGDLAGFLAATWLRGVQFVQVPTTLLAAVDASVGGKTGVNLQAGKNLLGAFHQPQAVIIETDFLQTLADRDFAAGLAESVKHAVIRDPQFLNWHESNADALASHSAGVLEELIARNCAIKAEVVGQDEREAGLRAILNYGHTIGHAIEQLLGYELRHGECVALGMLVENEIACRRGWLGRAAAERIRNLLGRFGLPLRLPRALSAEEVSTACRVDKKARGGAVSFVLLQDLGEPRRVADVSDADILAGLGVIQPA